MIRIEHLNHRVDEFSLRMEEAYFPPGIHLIVGANGAGKTTLLKLLSTVLMPHSGQILYQGTASKEHLPLIRSHIGYLPAEIELYGHMTSSKFLSYMAELKGVFAPGRVEQVMRECRIEPFRKVRISKLSQGQQRRIAIAQSMLSLPRFLFLDEPMNGLDTEERRLVISRLVNYASTPGRVIAVSAHELNEWEGAAEYVTWLDLGELRFSGTAALWKRELPRRVWQGRVSKEQFLELSEEDLVHFRVENEKIHIRTIAEDQPLPGLEETEATLEDAYFIRRRGQKAITMK